MAGVGVGVGGSWTISQEDTWDTALGQALINGLPSGPIVTLTENIHT